MRRALAGQVRQEGEPLGARLPALRLGDERLELRGRVGDVAQPAQRAGGGEHHAHRVPRPGMRVAERVHAALGLGAVGVERGEDDARGAEHDRTAAPAGRRRRRARPPPGRRRRPRSGCRRRSRPVRVGRLDDLRQPRRVELRAPRAPRRSRRGARRRGAACRTRRRRRSRARRRGAAARSPWAAARGRCARRTSGSCRRSHRSFGAVKPGSARLPVSSTSRSRPSVDSISSHSAPVRPSFQRIAGRMTASDGVERDEPVHLAAEADAGRVVAAERAPGPPGSRATSPRDPARPSPVRGIDSG